ncbi:unnamed protein product [Urochloa decumbens]|uniref:Uncharacterized protein n=1 Tax=Urochloa decumbens TaxID=240449 RepID=A0ABC8ZGR5_9POAL
MDAMDEFQEADILWPDTTEDELAPFATTADMAMEEEVSSVVAPVFGRRRFEGLFVPGAAGTSSSSASASPDADEEEEWQEKDVLWPDTASIVSRGGGGGLLWPPFPGGSSSSQAARRVNHPAAARRDRWRPAASSPIDIPTNNVAARRRVNLGRR